MQNRKSTTTPAAQAVNQGLAGPYLSFKQAQEYLGSVPGSTLRQWTSTRRITSFQVGKRVLYRRDDLDRFVEAGIKRSFDHLETDSL